MTAASYVKAGGRIEGVQLSSGTLRPEDLIPCFRKFLWEDQSADPLYRECVAWENHQLPDHVYEIAASELLEALEERLNSLSPEGFYFGSHEGDPSCFGFWRMPDAS